MKLFSSFREREKKSQQTKNLMKELFINNIHDNENYNLLYAYNSYIEKNEYIYISYIIGYRESDMSLIVANTDNKLTKISKVIKYENEKIEKATYSKSKNLYTIYNPNKKDLISFIPVIKNYEDDDILAFIEQEEEIEDFKDFFSEFKRKSHRYRK